MLAWELLGKPLGEGRGAILFALVVPLNTVSTVNLNHINSEPLIRGVLT